MVQRYTSQVGSGTSDRSTGFCSTRTFGASRVSLCFFKLNRWLKFPYGELTGQLHYTRIKPLIIVEEYLK